MMSNSERMLIRHVLMYILTVKKWEFEVDDNFEMTFILGNREIETTNLSAEELENILKQVIRW